MKLRLLFSAAFSIAALSLPAMAHAQRSERDQVICNDGTVFQSANANDCRHHRGVRTMATTDNRRMDRVDNGRMENGKMLPGNRDVMQGRGDVMQGRGDVMQGRGGMTTAQRMAMLQIDHTRNHATAKCADGFYYHGAHVRSACSQDGGVANWYK